MLNHHGAGKSQHDAVEFIRAMLVLMHRAQWFVVAMSSCFLTGGVDLLHRNGNGSNLQCYPGSMLFCSFLSFFLGGGGESSSPFLTAGLICAILNDQAKAGTSEVEPDRCAFRSFRHGAYEESEDAW